MNENENTLRVTLNNLEVNREQDFDSMMGAIQSELGAFRAFANADDEAEVVKRSLDLTDLGIKQASLESGGRQNLTVTLDRQTEDGIEQEIFTVNGDTLTHQLGETEPREVDRQTIDGVSKAQKVTGIIQLYFMQEIENGRPG